MRAGEFAGGFDAVFDARARVVRKCRGTRHAGRGVEDTRNHVQSARLSLLWDRRVFRLQVLVPTHHARRARGAPGTASRNYVAPAALTLHCASARSASRLPCSMAASIRSCFSKSSTDTPIGASGLIVWMVT